MGVAPAEVAWRVGHGARPRCQVPHASRACVACVTRAANVALVALAYGIPLSRADPMTKRMAEAVALLQRQAVLAPLTYRMN